jgi:cytochrome c oxidase subunit II
MIRAHRWRSRMAAVLPAALAACSSHPNTTLSPNTEFGRAIDDLFDVLFIGGVTVLVLVFVGLAFVLVKYRHREGAPEPKAIHGNAVLEIVWTLIPAVVLAFIAVPTVRTIFSTQAEAGPNALQVEVIGHQWWWEFRYPQYGVVTANELYLPVGRTVNFALMTADVLHSFWIPQLGGKRDLIANDTTHVWFTPESAFAWNGFCAEYCGSSHANMRFRVFTVPPAEFDRWVAHQRSPAAGAPATPPPQAAADTAAVAGAAPTAPETTAVASVTPPAQGSTPSFFSDSLPAHVRATTPVPAGLTTTTTTGDAARGAQLFMRSTPMPCAACHAVQGVASGIVGPNLTHVGSRTSIGAGLYPNDARHLALWIKNSPAMKPGSKMPAFGKSAQLPQGLDDQQIADLAAYLLSLK